MKRLAITSALSAMLFASAPASADELFTGDTKLSCEAILCLATSMRPSECTPSITRYRSIRHKKFKDTLNARRSFLAICPKGPTTPLLESLLDAQSVAEQYCDPDLLNRRGDPRLSFREGGLEASLVDRGCGAGMWCAGEKPPPISNVLPAQCQALADHPFSYEAVPKYVGTPELFGYWVAAENYAAAVTTYNANLPAMIARRDAEAAAEAASGR